MPLDLERARQAVGEIAQRLELDLEQAAWAIIRLANSNMERAVRAVTLQRGYDPRRFTLFAFGGAGPLHAAELAEGLGMTQVLVPPHPGVMAALGLTVPDLQRDFYRTVLVRLDADAENRLQSAFAELEDQARAELAEEDLEGFGEPVLQAAVDMRYVGQSFDLRLPFTPSAARLREAFTRVHEDRYGYAAPGEAVEIVNVRLRARLPRLIQPRLVPSWPEAPGSARAAETRAVWFGAGATGPVGVADLRRLNTAVLWRPSLPAGTHIDGPALIE
jgi:N-methylhydantoinase A